MPTDPESPASCSGRCHCGAVGWRYDGSIDSATICNCSVCRRYGVLWAYGTEGVEIDVDAGPAALVEYACGSQTISFNFCRLCGNVVSWRERRPGPDGSRRIAVNLRLAEPDSVAGIRLLRFDGLHSFDDLPPDGRVVRDVWF